MCVFGVMGLCCEFCWWYVDVLDVLLGVLRIYKDFAQAQA